MRPRIRLTEPEDFSPAPSARLDAVAEVTAGPCTEGDLAEALADCDVFWFRLGVRASEWIEPIGTLKELFVRADAIALHVNDDDATHRIVDDVALRAAEHDNFTWTVALSEPRPEDDWQGPVGYVHRVLDERHLRGHPHPEECEYYLCGPPLMIQTSAAMRIVIGVK